MKVSLGLHCFKLLILSFVLLVAEAKPEYTYLAPIDRALGVAIELKSPFSSMPNSGTIPLFVTIQNNLPKQGSWKLVFSNTQYFDKNNHTHIEHFSVPASSTKTFEIIVPLDKLEQDCRGRQISLSISGTNVKQTIRELLPSSFCYNQYSSSLGFLGYTEAFSKAVNMTRTKNSDHTDVHLEQYLGAKLRLDLLPTNSQGLSGIQILAFTIDEYQQLTTAQQLALQEWITYGGVLLLDNTSGYTAPAQSIRTAYKDAGAYQLQDNVLGLGFGELRFIPYLSSDHRKAQELVNLLKDKESTQLLTSIQKHGKRDLLADLTSPSPPVALILLVIVIYAIIVGPYNIHVLVRKQRLLLYITTPLLAITTSILLLVGIVLADGIGAIGNRQLIIFLFPETKRMFTVQMQGYRSGLLLNTSFSLPKEAVLNPLDIDEQKTTITTFRESKSDKQSVDYYGNWFRNRVRDRHIISSNSTSRWALSVNSKEHKLYSTLPFAIEDFELIYKGQIYIIKQLESGSSYNLANHQTTAQSKSWSRLFNFGLPRTYTEIGKDSSHAFASGIINVPDNYFFDTLSGVKWNNISGYIFTQVLIVEDSVAKQLSKESLPEES